MNLAAIRSGIKTALAGIEVNVYDYQTLHPQTPAVVVGLPDSIDPHQSLGGTHTTYNIGLKVFVGLTDDQAADDTLEALLAEDGTAGTSIVAALDVDPTFGGACMSSMVTDVREFGVAMFDESQQVIACTVVVEVFT